MDFINRPSADKCNGIRFGFYCRAPVSPGLKRCPFCHAVYLPHQIAAAERAIGLVTVGTVKNVPLVEVAN